VKNPLKEGSHFTQNIGGVAGMFDNIRTNTQGISDVHAQTSKTLANSVLPIFTNLDAEIKSKQKELKKGVSKGAKLVDKTRKDTMKHVELLGQQTAAYDSAGHSKPDPMHDPYIIQRGVTHRLGKQIHEENESRNDMLAVQENFGQFEAHVIKSFQTGMGHFYQAVGNQADQQKQLYGNMVETTQRVDPLYEWKDFIDRNNNVLIDPSAPPRTLGTATFANQNHRSTQAMCQGSLERKSGLLKKFSSSLYVITPSKFLHEFETDDDEKKDPTPEMSLYLPDCTMGGINGSTFSVKGKDVKGKMHLSGAKEYEFRARTEKDAQTWWNVIKEVVTGQQVGEKELSQLAGGHQTAQPSALAGATGAMGGQQTDSKFGSELPHHGGAPGGAEGGYGGMGANPYSGNYDERNDGTGRY